MNDLKPDRRGPLSREAGSAMAAGWECVVVDPTRVQVESVCDGEDLAALGVHWFQVFFAAGSGRCFITSGEALRLRRLTTEWVKRALLDLARTYGSSWVEHALGSNPGLLLHHSDASEPAHGDPAGCERVVAEQAPTSPTAAGVSK